MWIQYMNYVNNFTLTSKNVPITFVSTHGVTTESALL